MKYIIIKTKILIPAFNNRVQFKTEERTQKDTQKDENWEREVKAYGGQWGDQIIHLASQKKGELMGERHYLKM